MRSSHIMMIAMGMIVSVSSLAQDKLLAKYGKVNPEDFSIKVKDVDTTAGAIIIADVGSSSFEGNNNGWFTLVHKHYRRVLILDRKGFDLATVEIPLYISSKSNSEEKLDKLKACTYNLEGGKVVETKLSDNAVFKDVKDKNHIVKKFTMPAIRAGSIIEYSYTINSDFLFNLQPWRFQGSYPRLWSEYEVKIPEFFEYVFLPQGYIQFDVFDKSDGSDVYYVRQQNNDAFSKDDQYKITARLSINRWVMKNVPPLVEEKFISTPDNYISKVEFQLAAYNFPGSPRKDIMSNWTRVGEDLMNDPDFGEGVKSKNNWMDAELGVITAGATSELEKANKIYRSVQSSYKNNGGRGIYLTKSIKEVFKSKSGNCQELNLLFIAMLRHAGIDANPVILSTTGNGFTHEYYPLLEKYNYVVCRSLIEGKNYFLDASQPYLGFGKLPSYAYNGHAQQIGEMSMPIYFSPDSLKETSMTSVMLFNDPAKAGRWAGNYNNNFGYVESSNIRRYISENGKTGYTKKLNEGFTGEYSVDETEFEGLEENESGLKVFRKLAIENNGNPSLIYFSPMLDAGYKENPFKLNERKFPVEMPYKMDDIYILKIDIPAGYVVDEIPKSEKATFNDNEGYFEYIITQTDKDVSLRSRIKFEKAVFPPDDYEGLKAIFDHVVRKHAEKIVFKKK